MSTPSKVENINQAIQLINSTNINDVIRGLNYLLQKSYEANELNTSNNAVFVEQYPQLLTSLGNLLDVINPSGKLPFQQFLTNDENNYYSFLFGDLSSGSNEYSATNEWKTDIPGIDIMEFKFLSAHLDSNQFITIILSIIRNLSFEIANEVYLAYHTTIIRQVMSIMISSLTAPKLNENLQLIFEFLSNIGHKLEFNGKKRQQLASGFLDEIPVGSVTGHHPQYQQQFRQNKELLKFKMSYEMSHQSTVEYTASVKALPAILNGIISRDYFINRFYTVKALELFLKLASNSENEAYFNNSPLEFLENLISLLAVSNTTIIENQIHVSPIPENYIIIGDPFGKTRPLVGVSTPLIQSTSTTYANQSQPYGSSATQITSNYAGTPFLPSSTVNSFFPDHRALLPNAMINDQVDMELRDLVIDSLHYLCRISILNRQRLVQIPHALLLIYKLASHPLRNLNYFHNVKRMTNNPLPVNSETNPNPIGSTPSILNANPPRSDSHSKAAYLFALFGTIPEAFPVFQSLKNELILFACSDDVFADLVMNKLTNVIFGDNLERAAAAALAMDPMIIQ